MQVLLRFGQPLGRLISPAWQAAQGELYLQFSLWQPWVKPGWQSAQPLSSLWQVVQQQQAQPTEPCGKISLSLHGRSGTKAPFVLPPLQLELSQVQAGVQQHQQQRQYITEQQSRFRQQVQPGASAPVSEPAQPFHISQGNCLCWQQC